MTGVSPSPRKAWIETQKKDAIEKVLWSPSPRKAWIETPLLAFGAMIAVVAFPPEGVD